MLPGGDGEPEEPDWTTVYSDELDIAAARIEWGVVIRELKGADALTVANGHAIRRLVEFRVQYDRASKHVAEHGPVLKGSRRAKVGQWNPFWSVMRQSEESIRALEAELGLAPTRRGKIVKATQKQSRRRAADDYLGQAKG